MKQPCVIPPYSYEDFAVIVPDDTFKTTANLIKFGFYLLKDLKENEQKYAKMYKHLVEMVSGD